MEPQWPYSMQKMPPAWTLCQRLCSECQSAGTRFERSAGNGTYGGPNNIPDMQDVNINNISSYFVLGFVYICPLSFLVDTGAGVSLLCGDIWEKAVPRGSACDYQGTCRLVGVDGIPIKVRGAASVDMVEGHITAEGILGMDFLEQKSVFWTCVKESY